MDKFWLNDLTTLFNRNNLFKIIPYSNLDLSQKLNSILRPLINLLKKLNVVRMKFWR